jgi:hypothetical protein
VGTWVGLEGYLFEKLYGEPASLATSHVEDDRESLSLAWSALDDCLMAVAGAATGARTDTLLRLGGRACFLHAVGQGFGSTGELEAALFAACETNGLISDYSQKEIVRKVRYMVRTLADASVNPYLKGGVKPRGDEGQLKVIGPLAPGQAAVLLDVVKRHGWSTRHAPEAYSGRYGESRTGVPKRTVDRALSALVGLGLLESGPGVWNAGSRATKTYKPTRAGVEAARSLAKEAA